MPPFKRSQAYLKGSGTGAQPKSAPKKSSTFGGAKPSGSKEYNAKTARLRNAAHNQIVSAGRATGPGAAKAKNKALMNAIRVGGRKPRK